MARYLDPNADGANNAWSKSSGSVGWSLIDDAVRQPTTPNTADYVNSVANNAKQDAQFASDTYAAGTWTLWVYGAGGTKRAVQYAINTGGGFSAAVELFAAGEAATWKSVNVSADVVSQGTLDNFEVEFICKQTAGGGGATDVFVYAAYLEGPDVAADRRAYTSWTELEVPTAPRRAHASWAELEAPDAPRRALTSWAEFETPLGPRRALVSWGEAEVPIAPRRGQASWAEFEVPAAPTTDRRAFASWTELEVPTAPRRALASWTELETPDGPRRAFVSWSELEVPPGARRALASWVELETPPAARRAAVSWVEVETPDGPRRLYVSWGELEVPTAPRRALVSWGELETPSSPNRRVLVGHTELEVPGVYADVPGATVTWTRMYFGVASTWAALLADAPNCPDGYMAIARDTGYMYFRWNGEWLQLSTRRDSG